MSKYQEWKGRKAGFDNHVTLLAGQRTVAGANKLSEEKPDDPTENLINLVVFLSAFTDNLFEFFLNGFAEFLGEEIEDPKRIKLIPSAEYPPEYVLQRILQQASFDLTVIERAVEQRKDPDSELAKILAKYDDLALSALAASALPSNNSDKGLIELVKPFVYFQRDTSVRIIPYANALLIGIPFSALSQPIDLLSIPHEIGHHVYQTGHFSETKPINLFFEKFFANRPDWVQNWLQEIFADLYGFLAAGPIAAFSLQEILLDNLPVSLAEDDGDHPVGIIRPLIYLNLFNSKDYQVRVPAAEAVAEVLRKKWQSEVTKRGFANSFLPVTADQALTVAEGSGILGSVLQAMNEQIHEETDGAFDFPEGPDSADHLHPWTFFPNGKSDDQFDPDHPFEGFSIEKTLQKQNDQIEKVKQLYGKKFKLSRREDNAFWLTGQIRYWGEKVDSENYPPLPPLLPNIWKLIFTAFNWAEQGPDDTRPA